MEEKRTSGVWVVVTATFVLLSIMAYVVGYQYLCVAKISGDAELRYYRHDWQAWVFKPGAVLDSVIRGMEVEVTKVRSPNSRGKTSTSSCERDRALE